MSPLQIVLSLDDPESLLWGLFHPPDFYLCSNCFGSIETRLVSFKRGFHRYISAEIISVVHLCFAYNDFEQCSNLCYYLSFKS